MSSTFSRRALESQLTLLLHTRRGIIMAAKELDMTIPLIVRLQGTKEAEAKK